MFPKEHGAWNALILSMAVGWTWLGHFDVAALWASLAWSAGFLSQRPFRLTIQYHKADKSKAKKALFLFLIEAAVALIAGFFFLREASEPSRRWALEVAFPLAATLGLLFLWRRTLRFLAAELLGFVFLCLLAPILGLNVPDIGEEKALWLFFLLSGYFLTTVFYVRLRRKWFLASREKPRLPFPMRLKEGWRLIILQILFLGVAFFCPHGKALVILGAAESFLKTTLGLLAGKPSLPLMKLGLREMIYSLLFALLIGAAFKNF